MPLLRRVTEHWQLKLLSLIFAGALWMFVTSQDQGEAVLTIPLDLIDPPSGVEVTSVGAETVVIRVAGRRGVLSRLRDADLRAEVSLRDARPGRFVARIQPRNIVVPRGVNVVQVTPSQVRATLEAR